jgi:hypothetical protein
MSPSTTRSSSTLTREAGASTAPLVLLGGAVTIALALAGVWLASRSGENVMGWYANYVIPMGAILVGLVASSGFGIASYASGTKVTGGLLLAVVALLLGGYWLAQYLAFLVAFPDGAVLANGEPAGFFDYYDAVTRSFHWVEHGRPGKPFGALGYLMRLGEIVGFTGGGVIIPFALRKLPYCDACRVYMKSPLVARIPAGIAWKKVNAKKQPQEAQAQDLRARQALEDGQAKLQAVLAAAAKDGPSLEQALAEHGTVKDRSVEKLSARIWVHLVHCRRCGQGELRADLVTGQGKQVKRMVISRSPVDRAVVVSLQRLSLRRQRA